MLPEHQLKNLDKTLKSCAVYYNVPITTLYRIVKCNKEYEGSGRYSKRLTKEEEFKII